MSGETSSGGKARLPALLKEHQPAIVVLELGGNDGLRGIPVQELAQATTRNAREALPRLAALIG